MIILVIPMIRGISHPIVVDSEQSLYCIEISLDLNTFLKKVQGITKRIVFHCLFISRINYLFYDGTNPLYLNYPHSLDQRLSNK